MNDSVAFPSSAQDLRELVAAMRELGVIEACGVKLGAEPAPAPKQETVKERSLRELQEFRDETRDMLAANGVQYSVEALDRMRPPPAELVQRTLE